MAYSAPELLLVGAAQQLVLETSQIVAPPKEAAAHCNILFPEDGVEDQYDGTGGW